MFTAHILPPTRRERGLSEATDRRPGLPDEQWGSAGAVAAGLVTAGSAVVVEQAAADRRDPGAGAATVHIAAINEWL
jgi:hypothetical protein